MNQVAFPSERRRGEDDSKQRVCIARTSLESESSERTRRQRSPIERRFCFSFVSRGERTPPTHSKQHFCFRTTLARTHAHVRISTMIVCQSSCQSAVTASVQPASRATTILVLASNRMCLSRRLRLMYDR